MQHCFSFKGNMKLEDSISTKLALLLG